MSARRYEHEMIAALQAVAELVDGPVTVTAFNRLRHPSTPSAPAITKRYGGWHRALSAAGLEPSPRRQRKWTREEALEAVRAWLATSDDHRWQAYDAALRADPALPREAALRRLFVGWKGTLAAIDALSQPD